MIIIIMIIDLVTMIITVSAFISFTSDIYSLHRRPISPRNYLTGLNVHLGWFKLKSLEQYKSLSFKIIYLS